MESYLKICNYFSSRPHSLFSEKKSALLSPGQISIVYQNCHNKRWTKLTDFFFSKEFVSKEFNLNSRKEEVKLMMEDAKKLSSKFIIEELLLKGKEEIKTASFLELYQQILPEEKYDAVSIWEKIKNIKPSSQDYQGFSAFDLTKIRKDEKLCFDICAIDYLKRRFLKRFSSQDISQHSFFNNWDDNGNLFWLMIEDAARLKLSSGLTSCLNNFPGEFYDFFLKRPYCFKKGGCCYVLLAKQKWCSATSFFEKILDINITYKHPLQLFTNIFLNFIVFGGQEIIDIFSRKFVQKYISVKSVQECPREDIDNALSQHRKFQEEFTDFLFATFSSLGSSSKNFYIPRDICRIIMNLAVP